MSAESLWRHHSWETSFCLLLCTLVRDFAAFKKIILCKISVASWLESLHSRKLFFKYLVIFLFSFGYWKIICKINFNYIFTKKKEKKLDNFGGSLSMYNFKKMMIFTIISIYYQKIIFNLSRFDNFQNVTFFLCCYNFVSRSFSSSSSCLVVKKECSH